GQSRPEVYAIEEFVEKPDLKTAEKYVASGRYCWNSGMFLFKAKDVYEELERFAPDIVSASRRAWEQGVLEDGALCLGREAFEGCPSDSIDYAVMEKTDKGAMIPFQAGWSDLGSWAAMWEAGEKDGDGNVINGEVIARGMKNSLVFSDHRLVAVLGMEDCVVVDTRDALLVARRCFAQDVKAVVSDLKEDGRMEALCHELSYRAWGWEARIAGNKNHVIRRLNIKPSAQMEHTCPGGWKLHWTVIAGTGRMEQKGSSFDIQKGFVTGIVPQGLVKLENTGKDTLEIIEVGFSA
ncbi:MAG: sugar phosphate nucleotidyltransferase, partial [Desulfosalsimonas sp.]